MIAADVARKDGGAFGRMYVLEDGTELPSVTNILSALSKPALIPWAAKEERTLVMKVATQLYTDMVGAPSVPALAYYTRLEQLIGKEKAYKRTSAKALDVGSQAHALIEHDLRGRMGQVPGPEPAATEPARHAFAQWQAWAEQADLEPLAVEQTVYSRTYGFAGTLDLLARVEGELAVLDWKAAKALYPEYKLQNVAYRHAVQEMGHGAPTRGYVVRLPKQPTDPVTEIMQIDEPDALFAVFLHLLEVWRWQAGNEAEYQAKRKASAA